MESALDERNDGTPYRTLPHNIEAEQALLGAMLVNNEAANRVSAFLRPEHFFHQIHGRIFAAIVKMVERGQIAADLGAGGADVPLAGAPLTVVAPLRSGAGSLLGIATG